MKNLAGSKIKSFTDLKTWQKGHELVKAVYSTSTGFPVSERLGLTNQIRRSAVSITSNIAEGFGRFSSKDKARFYEFSISSLYELQNQMLIARDLGYISKTKFNEFVVLSIEVSKLTSALRKGALASNF